MQVHPQTKYHGGVSSVALPRTVSRRVSTVGSTLAIRTGEVQKHGDILLYKLVKKAEEYQQHLLEKVSHSWNRRTILERAMDHNTEQQSRSMCNFKGTCF